MGVNPLIESKHDNTVVVRCLVREHGSALAGPDPTTVVDPIPVGTIS